MKKFLLTLIVTMLTCLGAWAQDEGTPLNVEVGSATYIYGYQFNQGGTYGPSVIKWDKGDQAGTTTLVSVTCDDAAVTATLGSDGSTSITANSACSNVPVKFNFEKIEEIWENGVKVEDRVNDTGVATFLVTAKGNTCELSITDYVNGASFSKEKKDGSFTVSYSATWKSPNGEQLWGVGSNIVQSTIEAVATVSDNNGTITVTPKKKGTTDIVIKSSYNGIEESATLHLTITDETAAESFSLASNAITIYQGQSDNITATYAPSTATFKTTISPDNQGLTAAVADGKLTISVPESATAQDYTITVSPQEGSVDENGDPVPSQTVTVTVKDKTHASSIDAPETVSVAYGYTKDIPVTFEPTETAVVTPEYPTIAGVTFSPATLNKDNKTITVTTTDAAASAVGINYTITLKSGAGATDEISETITLKIIAPQHVTGVTLKEGETVLGDTKTIDKDDKFTITAVVAPEDAADATLTWTNSDPSVASFNQTTGEVIGSKAGETTITATSQPIAGQPAKSAYVKVIVKETLTANVEGFPTAKEIGANFTPSVSVTNNGIAEGNYVVTYTIDASDVLTRNAETGEFTTLKAGTATVTINVNATEAGLAAHYKNAAPIQKVVEVKKNEYTLAISADKKLFKKGESGSALINVDEIKFNGNVITTGDYSITYAVSPTYAGVSVNPETGAVTVDASAAKGQATIVATLNPTDPANNTTATASVTLTIADVIEGGATIRKEGDFYVINVPYPGALEESLTKATDSGIADETDAVDALKAAENVKITGDLANSDIRQLVQYIGGKKADIETLPCKTLDMGEARMAEAITGSADPNKCSLVCGPTNETIPAESNKFALVSVENLTLPLPALGVVNGTVLPANMKSLTCDWYDYSGNSLKSLVIPEGWTETSAEAWANYNSDDPATGSASGLGHLTSLKLPDSMVKIGPYAFSGLMVKELHMPLNVDRIGAGAFSSSDALQDVYFYGPTPSYVDIFAFSGASQMANNTVADNAVKGLDPSISRYAYEKAGVMACLLHYPVAYKNTYIDTERVYKMLPVDQDYIKGNNPYTPEGWDADFITNKVVPNVKNPTAKESIQKTGAVVDYGIKDEVYGRDLIWPSQSQMMAGYSLAQAGYKWNGLNLDVTTQYDPTSSYESGIDRRGLYQFIVALDNATFSHTYEQDKWYTIALPFDMTPTQIREVFGADTQVCRFSKVVREYTSPDDKKIRLEFRNSVMAENDDRPKSNLQYDEALRSSDGKVQYDANGKVIRQKVTHEPGIVHHCPYMILPCGEVNAIPGVTNIFNGSDGTRKIEFLGYQRVSGYLCNDDFTVGEYTYSFAPILQETAIKKNSYVLTNYNGEHQYVFYKGKKVGDEYQDGGVANQNTAYVQIAHGAQELADFFTVASPSPSSFAPINASVFGTDDEVNGIEKIEIVCGTDKLEDNKVYTINGVLVNGDNLPAGLYIKNGKKFIVK